MRAGVLRHRVTVQRQVITRNAIGEAVRGWEDLATVWAGILPISGREFWAASQVNATTTHRVIMRALDGIDTSCRIVFGARYFGVDAVINPAERGQRIELMCTEGIGDGG